MDMADFARRAADTDGSVDPMVGLQIALYGVAGEAGSVVSEAKKWIRDGALREGTPESVGEELGDLLWYIAAVANRLGLDLNEVVEANLFKTAQIWNDAVPSPSHYDVDLPADQRLLRRMEVQFVEDQSGPFPIVSMVPLGDLAIRIGAERQRKQLGDVLNDNAALDDGYRFHDVIHLAHAAVLGWSPVLRALMGAKRKQDVEVDRVQDGARAIAIEEGLAAFVFNYAESQDFLSGSNHLDWEMKKHIRRTVKGLEVSDQPPVAWEETYRQAFDAYRALRDAGGGIVECDLDTQTVKVVAETVETA
jgi:NTP pyrophosphatase (non-canonical NTP hydrolase)